MAKLRDTLLAGLVAVGRTASARIAQDVTSRSAW